MALEGGQFGGEATAATVVAGGSEVAEAGDSARAAQRGAGGLRQHRGGCGRDDDNRRLGAEPNEGRPGNGGNLWRQGWLNPAAEAAE